MDQPGQCETPKACAGSAEKITPRVEEFVVWNQFPGGHTSIHVEQFTRVQQHMAQIDNGRTGRRHLRGWRNLGPDVMSVHRRIL